MAKPETLRGLPRPLTLGEVALRSNDGEGKDTNNQKGVPMKIIVDMMGGDNAPLAVLEGTAAAVKEYGVEVIGVGDEALVRKTAAEHNIPLDGITLHNCTETIEMCDEPARAIRSKKDSSIVVGLNMLKNGEGDAFVSAGSTGALHVGASLIVRTLRGVKRPAPATTRALPRWTPSPPSGASRSTRANFRACGARAKWRATRSSCSSL